jgi:hypothetical protein
MTIVDSTVTALTMLSLSRLLLIVNAFVWLLPGCATIVMTMTRKLSMRAVLRFCVDFLLLMVCTAMRCIVLVTTSEVAYIVK